MLENLDKCIDDGEQYSWRHCLRLLNVTLPSGGTKENCLQKVDKLLKQAYCGVSVDSVDRANRIGKVPTDGNIISRQNKFTALV